MSKKWFTNGTTQVVAEECPEGFHPGRLPVSEETRKKHSEHSGWKTMSEEAKATRAKKISDTIQNRTDEEKKQYSETISAARKGKGLGNEPWNKGKTGCQEAWNKGIPCSEETKEKIKATKQNKTPEEKATIEQKRPASRSSGDPWNKGIQTGPWPEEEKAAILQKQYTTKKENNSFNSSKPELEFLERLVEYYGADDIITQYSADKRYPFNCDFYIKSKDLFIELNLSWTHGGKLFEGTDEDMTKLAVWEEKAKTSEYYKNAIQTWTVRDVLKYKTAKQNCLNYLVIYIEDDFTRAFN